MGVCFTIVVINLVTSFGEVRTDLICPITLELTVRPGNNSDYCGLWVILLAYLNNTRIKLVHFTFTDLSWSSIHIFSYIRLCYSSPVPAHWTDRTLISITYRQQKLFRRYCYSLPGLSFNSNARNSLQNLPKRLNLGILCRSRELIIWHDVIKIQSRHKKTTTTNFVRLANCLKSLYSGKLE